MRINQYIAHCGISSRRKADQLIEEGRVFVNGKKVTSPGMQVEEGNDMVKVDGKIISSEVNKVYYMLNKPLRYISAVSDDRERNTVLELFRTKERIYPVGRLDYLSTGLLLLTNDGELANRLIHPRYHLEKNYFVQVKGDAPENLKERFQKGMFLDGYKTKPAELEFLGKRDGIIKYKVTLREGRNRQIRKMFEAARLKVVSLKRISMGNLYIGNLKEGEYRALTSKEVQYLKKVTGLKENKE